MTIINRALHKAYKRRSSAEPGTALEPSPSAVNGWASTLREPIRPIPPSGRLPVPAPRTAVIGPDGSLAAVVTVPRPTNAPAKAPALVVASNAATTRFDAPHGRTSGPPATDARPVGRQSFDARALDSLPGKYELNSVDPAARSEKEKTVDLRLDAIATLERRAGAARLTTTAAGPAWAWPAIVAKLLACPAGDELRALARRLAQFSTAGGVRSIAFSGPGRCAGRTSLLLTLAQVLTELPSTRVAIVDADFGNPRAAAMLSVFPEAGLFEAASQAASHGSTVTTLMPGKLAIVPLIKRVAVDALDRGKIEAIQNFLRSLRHAYDVVLLDAGPWESLIPPLVFEGRAVDALICVSRASAAHVEQLDDDSYCQPGVEWLGVIETFAQS